MKLLGAKEFLKTVKSGTLCIEFWLDDEEECFDLIKDYKNGMNLSEILQRYYGEFYIFGDNYGSLSFLISNNPEDEDEEDVIEGYTYNCLNYYDKNIVGDASPNTTLQLVFENEEEWPEKILIRSYQTEKNNFLFKDDIKRIQKWFLTIDHFETEHSEALKWLDSDYYKKSKIVNYKGD